MWWLAAAALLFATPAQADPISAIVGALTFLGIGAETAAAVAPFLAAIFVSTGLNYIATALGLTTQSKKPSGVSGYIQSGGALPRAFILGEFATAGSLVYAGTWGSDGKTPNAYLTYVIALSDLPMSALTQLWVGSSQVTLSTARSAAQGYAVPEFYTGGQDYLWIRFYDGTQTAADSFLTSTFGSDPNYPWASNMAAPGTAYVIMTARLNTSLFSGFPQFKFAGQGAKLYDPRQDSTAGGSGTQRLATPATWAWSNNPKVIEYNILLGLSDAAGWLWGPQGMSQARLPFAAWSGAMNECDALVTDDLGNTVLQYQAGAEVTVDMQPADVIDALNMACNGKTAEIGGIYKPLVGAAGTSVFSFSDAGVIISAANTASPFPSLTNVINGIAGTYPERLQGWAMTAAPVRNDSAAETADGKYLLVNVQYAAVPYSDQVQRLMASALLEGRKFRTHTIVLPPPAFVLEPTDTITWTSTVNGYTAKLFTVKSVSALYNCDIQVGIAEVDPADYNFNPSTDYLAYVPVPIALELPPLLDLPIDDTNALLRQALAALDDLGQALIQQSWTIGGAAISTSRALAFARFELTEAISNGLTAEAGARLDLEASINDGLDLATASGLFQITAVAAPGDAAASLAMEVSATAGGVFSQAGLYMDALIAGGSRIRLSASQIELDGTVMTGGGVTGAMLASGAATGTMSGTFSGVTGLNNTSWNTLCAPTAAFTGNLVQIDCTVIMDTVTSSARSAKFHVTRDGTEIHLWPLTSGHGFTVQSNSCLALSFSFDDAGAGAGSHTYALEYAWVGTTSTQTTFEGALRGTEIRR